MRRNRSTPPNRSPAGTATPNLFLLDRFTEKDLETWTDRSEDLDELYRLLYLAVEPERIRKREAILAALNVKPAPPVSFERWVRIVEHRWTNLPLSSAGSLLEFGGRFNIGQDIDLSLSKPFPALYIGDSYETAYRERYQLGRDQTSQNGLSPEDLALGVSTSNVFLRGHVERVLDVSDPLALAPVCRIFSKFKLPAGITQILKRLKAPPQAAYMIRTAAQLQMAMQVQNWRTWPVQFGIPSPSQQFAELAQAAGYEAIRYRSTKNPSGQCLAIFSGSLGSNKTFVDLADPYPPEVSQPRLDLSTADELAGWDCIRSNIRPTR